jgi:hypothetical protein
LLDFLLLPFRLLFRIPAALITAPQRLMGMSLPTRAAVLVAIFLVTCVIVAYASFLLRPYSANYAVWLRPLRIGTILVLLVVIPLVVRQALRLWMEGDVSRFPDVDFAWKEGLAALAKSGIDPNSVPLFLVLGARDEVQARALFSASRLGLRVRDVPAGSAALHWFASPDAVYLVSTEACRLSRLSRKASELPLTTSPAVAGPRIDGTLLPGAERSGGGRGERAPSLTGTLQYGAGVDREEPAAALPHLRGTMEIASSMQGGAAGGRSTAAVRLSTAETAKESARLEYVRSLLQHLRQNLCPLNGIMALLSFDVIQRGEEEGKELASALKEDLRTIHETTQLRCSVTAVVVGMEAEPGFSELVRRVGSERAADQRFGKGSRVWSPPIPDLVEAVSANACASFESWVYQLFREKDGLTRPGNTDLYSLLIRIRQALRSRLTDILVESCASASPDRDEPMLFSGCYFAATGETGDQQAFVHSVFRKVEEQQNELAWTRRARQRDHSYRQLAWFGFLISGLLALSLVGMFVVRSLGE